MKRTIKIIRGVTLLEVMLVLAIASMIIVMSIRYYQSATARQQSNTFMMQLIGIVAAADQMAQTTGSYQTAVDKNPISTTNLAPLLPSNAFVTPWGASISIENVTDTSFELIVSSMPTAVCPLTRAVLSGNKRYSGSPTAAAPLTACAAGNWGIYYIANP